MAPAIPGRKTIIAVAVVFSVVLYVAGLLSGLAVSKNIDRERQEYSTFLTGYVSQLENELGNYQLRQEFIRTLDESRRCELSEQQLDEVAAQLRAFWDILPQRLEEYEYNRTLSEEYLAVKQEYTRLALQAYMVARENQETCESDVAPTLYFYAQDCAECIRQGKMLDQYQAYQESLGKTPLVFAIDIDAADPTVRLMRAVYNVSEAPALIIENIVLKERVYTGVDIALLTNETDLP